MNHQKSSTGGASESGFDPCATLDDLARLLEPTPFLRLGPLAYTLPGRRILVPTLHRMHFLATQWTAHGTSPLRTAAPLAPLRERIVELCRYDPSLAYARLSHAQLHALTEGCLGLFDGWMRRQAAWATDSASISLRAWSAFPGTSPAMPYMAALRVGCPVVDPATGLLLRDETKPLTIQPVVRAVRAQRRSRVPLASADPAVALPAVALVADAARWRRSALDARRLLETVTRAASTSVSLGPWPSCDMLGMTAARAPRNTARREGPERAPFLLGSG
ncbi:hypothetical protein PAPYR_8829 [Paratrimastix pyriformis]|uniref:Uncharacterized protein n=1 Tax=Paratrimastix pyriformis TaxID=342808 RepID=A0ABQ8UCH1_9EUKA|nr:hypothetical protein PAPYR_8829 [Paratrimastix pyriformis]